MKQRILPLILCFFSVGLCLSYAKFRGTYSPWWNAHGGGIPYVLFWILATFVVVPKRNWIFAICAGCVIFTCILEFAQLWNPPPLADFRRTRFGAALLGSAFVWHDFPAYFIGGLIGYIVLRSLLAWRPTETVDSDS